MTTTTTTQKPRYALTDASKRRIAYNLRRRIELYDQLPSDALHFFSGITRYKVLIERWAKRLGRNLCPWDAAQMKEERWLQNLFREFYAEGFGGLPTECMDKNNVPLYPIAVMDDGTYRTVNPAEDNRHNQSSSSDPKGDPAETGNDTVGRGPTEEKERVQTDWGDRADAVIKRINNKGNQSPQKVRSGANRIEINRMLPLSNQLLAKVRRALLADTRSVVKRYRDSGNLDMRRLTDIVGMTDVSTVYQQHTRGTALDACVQLYIDCSGSMQGSADNHASLMERAVAVAACMSKVLERLRIPLQLITYDDTVRVIKQWSSRWEKSRLSDVVEDGNTDVPNALLSEVPAMMRRREQRKVAFIITDGNLSAPDPLYNVNGELGKWKKRGFEVYAIGLNTNCLICPDVRRPNHDYWKTVGIGDRVFHWKNRGAYESNAPHYKETVGFNGGIDEVDASNLLPKLSSLMVSVLTQGRQSI